MARHKNSDWQLPDRAQDWTQVNAAILMDIRDELRQLNSILACPNFLNIPHTLRSIDKKLTKKRKPKAKGSRPSGVR